MILLVHVVSPAGLIDISGNHVTTAVYQQLCCPFCNCSFLGEDYLRGKVCNSYYVCSSLYIKAAAAEYIWLILASVNSVDLSTDKRSRTLHVSSNTEPTKLLAWREDHHRDNEMFWWYNCSQIYWNKYFLFLMKHCFRVKLREL